MSCRQACAGRKRASADARSLSRRFPFPPAGFGQSRQRATLKATRSWESPKDDEISGCQGGTVQRRPLQQHDRLAVADFACLDHLHGVVQRNFHDLDILVLMGRTATLFDTIRGFDNRGEEMNDLGHGAGRHERLEQEPHVPHDIARFLCHLAADGLGRVIAVQQASRRLKEPAVMTVHMGRHPKLPHQDNRLASRIKKQNRRTVATVIGFAPDDFRFTTRIGVIIGDVAQVIPVL
ncbi:hypothetical protein AT6N2_C1199 [Agrobacterium tumefaciens]|nr:hypothetical protein AT6N2_C1199 [Agrobacterium tumefaciens]